MSITVHKKEPSDKIIKNNGFFPDILIQTFQDNYRVDGRLDENVLADLLVTAIIEVNDNLDRWVNEQTAAKLEETSTEQINSENKQLSLYKKAVYHRAKASLLRDFTDYSTTKLGHDRADDKRDNANYHYTESTRAIRSIKGKRGVRVALIKGSLNPFI